MNIKVNDSDVDINDIHITTWGCVLVIDRTTDPNIYREIVFNNKHEMNIFILNLTNLKRRQEIGDAE